MAQIQAKVASSATTTTTTTTAAAPEPQRAPTVQLPPTSAITPTQPIIRQLGKKISSLNKKKFSSLYSS